MWGQILERWVWMSVTQGKRLALRLISFLNYLNCRNLYSTFITPWADSSSARHMVEPEYHLPSCYDVRPQPPGPNKAAAFSDETLFFMFYSNPKDALQEVAAQELYVSIPIVYVACLIIVYNQVEPQLALSQDTAPMDNERDWHNIFTKNQRRRARPIHILGS